MEIIYCFIAITILTLLYLGYNFKKIKNLKLSKNQFLKGVIYMYMNFRETLWVIILAFVFFNVCFSIILGTLIIIFKYLFV